MEIEGGFEETVCLDYVQTEGLLMLHVALRGSQHISLVASNHARHIRSRFVFPLKSICDSASPIFHFVAQSSSELLSSSASDRSAMGNRRRAATPLSWVSSGEKSCRWNKAQTFNCTIGEKQTILPSCMLVWWPDQQWQWTQIPQYQTIL